MTHDTEKLKMLLVEETKKLEEELASVGRKNPENEMDWEATPEKGDTLLSDKNEAADAIEDFEARAGIQVVLENRLVDVRAAIERMEKGTYGICRICGNEIEPERFSVNPAAATCKAHMDS